MPKRLAILSSTYLPVLGGIQFYLRWFLKGLDDYFSEFQNQFDAFYFFLPQDYAQSELLDFKHIKVRFFPSASKKSQIFSQIFGLSQLIKKEKIDLLHCHDAYLEAFLCSAVKFLQKTPYVITAHGHDIAYIKELDFGARLHFLRDKLIALNCSRASALTSISKDMCCFAQELVPPEKVHLIPNMYEYPEQSFSKEEIRAKAAQLAKKYEISEDVIVFITLSGNRVVKGHENKLKAFAKYLEKQPNAKLLLAAHGERTSYLKHLAKDLGLEKQVCFIGFVEGLEKAAFFDLSHVYVNTAFFEPFGLVYLEAMQSKLAVLASPFGGGKDIFEDGVSALLPSPYSVEEITKAMLAISQKDLRQKLVKNAQAKLDNFHVKVILDKFFKLYQTL